MDQFKSCCSINWRGLQSSRYKCFSSWLFSLKSYSFYRKGAILHVLKTATFDIKCLRQTHEILSNPIKIYFKCTIFFALLLFKQAVKRPLGFQVLSLNSESKNVQNKIAKWLILGKITVTWQSKFSIPWTG